MMQSEAEQYWGVLYRGRPRARITAADYEEAIQALIEAKSQLEPDGDNCHVCHDSGHQAWECPHNPLAMARIAAAARGADGSALPWRCFHCGEIFADFESAQEHFGHNRAVVAECRRKFICTPCAGTGFTDLGRAAQLDSSAVEQGA